LCPYALLGPLLARARGQYLLGEGPRATLRASYRAATLVLLEDILEYGQTVAYAHGAVLLAAFIELAAADAPEEGTAAAPGARRGMVTPRRTAVRWGLPVPARHCR